MPDKLSWGIIGLGRIARDFARDLSYSGTGSLYAVASRSTEKAAAFAAEFGALKYYGDYREMLDDPEVNAIYIATPHPAHAEWAKAGAAAGKHILCEKPMAMNYKEAKEIVDTASSNGVFLMEGFMYRCHPQTMRLMEIIRSGAIGEVKVIQASFGFKGGFDPASRLLNPALGGGAILDVGCYCSSMARLIAGAASGDSVAEPEEIVSIGHIGDITGVDEYTAALLRFPGDITAQLSTGVLVQLENSVKVFGSDGMVHVPDPWVPTPQCGRSVIFLKGKHSSVVEEIEVISDRPIYALEADLVSASLPSQQAIYPGPSWEDTLGNMVVLDKWRNSL